MDYTLPALKLLIGGLERAGVAAASTPGVTAIGNLRFQRAWLQGILVAGGEEPVVLDDGSGVIELLLVKGNDRRLWKPGMYVLVVGAYATGENGRPVIKVHKIVDLSTSPDREALWSLEIIEAHRLFYQDQI